MQKYTISKDVWWFPMAVAKGFISCEVISSPLSSWNCLCWWEQALNPSSCWVSNWTILNHRMAPNSPFAAFKLPLRVKLEQIKCLWAYKDPYANKGAHHKLQALYTIKKGQAPAPFYRGRTQEQKNYVNDTQKNLSKAGRWTYIFISELKSQNTSASFPVWPTLYFVSETRAAFHGTWCPL